MNINAIETPALIVEKTALEANLERMDALLAASPMTLYPHYKSHKCPRIARMQLRRGAGGITCAKLSEAEDLADAGVETIVLANQVVQAEKLPKLARLAGRCNLTVCADDADNVLALEHAAAGADARVRVLVEYEVGMRRCGVESPEALLALARLIDAQPHLSFEGIQAYAGHLSHERDGGVRRSELAKVEALIWELKRYLEANGLPVRNICGGSTGFAAEKPADTAYTQLQTGSYLFMDQSYQALDLDFEQSLYVLATVVSVKADRVVLDVGVKSLSMDQDPPRCPAFPGAELLFSEEHLTLLASGTGLKPGDKVRCVPGHCCTTVNLFDRIHLVDGGQVLDVWPVVSRGKAQ